MVSTACQAAGAAPDCEDNFRFDFVLLINNYLFSNYHMQNTALWIRESVLKSQGVNLDRWVTPARTSGLSSM